MGFLLELMGRLVARHPGTLFALLVVVTLVAGGLATQLRIDTDITEFAGDTPIAQSYEEVTGRFDGYGTSIQVVVDAGRGGDVLSPAGLAVARRIEELATATTGIAEALATEGAAGSRVISYATPAEAALTGLGDDLDAVPAGLADGVIEEAFARAGERIAPLLSTDADLTAGTARAGLVVVRLDPGLSDDARLEASLALRDVLRDEDLGWFEVRAFSFPLIAQDIDDGLLEDLPVLLIASFLLIVVILWLLFRRVSDLALGVLAIAVAIVWMAGGAVLLGPDFLGVTGGFSQIAVAVPVLLVGLGIDYTVHLLARYRECLAAGSRPPRAARTTMTTVGLALILATATTVVGFLSNLATPLPPIADFGVFAAVGILAAFLVTGLLVPGARVLLDRRRPAGAADAGSGDGIGRLGAALSRFAGVASRAPVVVLAVAGVLAVGAMVAAGGLDTEFSQEDFIPAGSDAEQLIEIVEQRFGGDVSERTLVLVEGDLTDPAVAGAILDVRQRLAGVEHVVSAGGLAEVTSAPTLVEELDTEASGAAERLAAQLDTFVDPEATVDELPLREVRHPDELPADARQQAGEAAAADVPGDLTRLERRLPTGLAAGEALLRALPGADLDAAVRTGLVEELRAGTPVGVDDEVLAAAAELTPEEIDGAVLEALGFPTAELDTDLLAQVDVGRELRAAGWDGEGFAPDADLEAIYDVVEAAAPAALAGVLSGDRTSGLLSVATLGGQQHAVELVAALEAALAPLEATGVQLLVVSEPLLLADTLRVLADAQTVAIAFSLVAAAALMVGYYGLARRRPTLGVIAMTPAVLAVVLTLGTMRVLGLSYNALTATVAAIAIGIGVPYGIHLTNRFSEERLRASGPAAALHETVSHTGSALAGSAITTASAFGVLTLSNLVPLRQFGLITAIVIAYALLAALFVESSLLVLFDRRQRRREGAAAPAPTVGEPEPSRVGVR